MDLIDYYRSFEVTTVIKREFKDINMVQLIVFCLIAGLLDRKGSTTMFEVNKLNSGENKLRLGGTHRYINELFEKGYLNKQRTGAYFSKTYLSLTEKGLLLKSRLNSILSIPLEG